jgi:ribosomal-protein-alanine N-acetyltransferase
VIAEIPFSFEPMHWQDVPTVMAIEHRSFTLPWSASTYRHEILENANAHYYVLRHRAEAARPRFSWLLLARRRTGSAPIVGYGGFWMIVGEAHISTIAIDVGWRSRGLGEYLLASLIEQAMALQAASITLEVRESNLPAQNLYRKYGFVVTGQRPRYYQDNHENAFLMTVSGVDTSHYREQFERWTAALMSRLAALNGDGYSAGDARRQDSRG